jgi:uncharacterized OB-fold protein
LMRPKSGANNPGNPVVSSKQAYVKTSYTCGSCGANVLPTAKFCGNCGSGLATTP